MSEAQTGSSVGGGAWPDIHCCLLPLMTGDLSGQRARPAAVLHDALLPNEGL